MELPEVSRALNDWQRMRNYNAELLAEQTQLIKERDAVAAQNRELVEALRNLLDMTDHFPECNEFRGGYVPFSKKTARDLLAKHGR